VPFLGFASPNKNHTYSFLLLVNFFAIALERRHHPPPSQIKENAGSSTREARMLGF
jgi:hypothetical protein